MFAAYFDESGTGQDIMTVAGFLARSSVWVDQFEPVWQGILDRENLTHFHMTDFENYHGEYEGWTLERHQTVIKDLIAVIRSIQPYGVAVSLDLRAFRELQRELQAVDIRHSYHLGAMWCVVLLLDQSSELAPSAIAWTFEEGAEGTGDLKIGLDLLSARLPSRFVRVSPLSFAEKEKVLPLQAADLWAHEAWKQQRKELGLHDRPARRSLVSLVEGMEYAHMHLDRQFLTKMIADIRKRGRF